MSYEELPEVVRRKSTLSGGNGGSCVEVGVWRRSSLSNANGGQCVEVATVDGAQAEVRADADRLFLVRDSKDSDGPVLTFTPSEWAGFLGAIKGGGFDEPVGRREM
ncbi:DUF397 domain-containing protein [Streptosporangium sp. NPDC001559]|uniref:DUF397 domain-containing protein n=1 Tax=Streptosporangium sp. NPDC001559 TaxID=3366187 RepID=UPI0036E08798